MQAMVDAMEDVPSLVVLNLGDVRDAGMRWRVQAATTANIERARAERARRSRAGSDSGPAPLMKPRRSLSFERPAARQRVGSDASGRVSSSSVDVTAEEVPPAPEVVTRITAMMNSSIYDNDENPHVGQPDCYDFEWELFTATGTTTVA